MDVKKGKRADQFSKRIQVLILIFLMFFFGTEKVAFIYVQLTAGCPKSKQG